MAVIVQFIVVRDGDEKMTFATKKEADAYDKMLDIADHLFDFLGQSDLGLNETVQEEVSLLLAEKREEVMPILRGISPKAQKPSKKAAPTSNANPADKGPAKPAAAGSNPGTPAPKKTAKATPRTKAANAPKNG